MKIELNLSKYPEDCKRIQKILKGRDYEASLIECDALWQKYSDDMCAGWMGLPKNDDDVFNCISSYFEKQD